VYQKRWVAGDGDEEYRLEARVVETDSPTNPGDSGGPLANDKGELVGVTQGNVNRFQAAALSTFIDGSEVQRFLNTQTVREITTGRPPIVAASRVTPPPKATGVEEISPLTSKPNPGLVTLFHDVVAARKARLRVQRDTLGELAGQIEEVCTAPIGSKLADPKPVANPEGLNQKASTKTKSSRGKGKSATVSPKTAPKQVVLASEADRLDRLERLGRDIDATLSAIQELPEVTATDIERAVPAILPLAVGGIGRAVALSNDRVVLSAAAKVVQVVSPTRALVRGFNSDHLIMLRGVSTAGVTDGQLISLPGIYEVIDTETYRTALGATNTVFVVQPADLKTLDPLRSESNEALQKEIRHTKEQGRQVKAEVTGIIEHLRSVVAAEAAAKKSEAEEKTAESKLLLAKSLLNDSSKKAQAWDRLDRIVKDHPGTKAAAEAEKLLKEFKWHP
jgi:hypothetical protein